MARGDGIGRTPRAGARTKSAHPERQAAFRVGLSAESRAAAFLIAKGFRILARRWRSPLGEIERTIREIGDISGAIAAAVTQQGAATQEIARSVEVAARRTADTADEVGHVGTATNDTRASADAVRTVADELGQVAGRIRSQVDQFFERLSA